MASWVGQGWAAKNQKNLSEINEDSRQNKKTFKQTIKANGVFQKQKNISATHENSRKHQRTCKKQSKSKGHAKKQKKLKNQILLRLREGGGLAAGGWGAPPSVVSFFLFF